MKEVIINWGVAGIMFLILGILLICVKVNRDNIAQMVKYRMHNFQECIYRNHLTCSADTYEEFDQCMKVKC